MNYERFTVIPTKNDNTTLTGNLGGSVTAMSIDMDSLAHIQSILTDLYSDPELAVIREYSINGLDSHRMAGVYRPIEISLPTTLRQTFEVKDFGLGLSVSDLQKVYGMFGASSKRETNEATGCLGLGSKSALTYTNMFTVRAVKNGVLTEAAIYKAKNSLGKVEIVDTRSTDEHNGVTIIIPTAGSNSFKEKAKAFFKHWDDNTVMVDGELVKSAFDGYLKLNDKVFVRPNPDNRPRGYYDKSPEVAKRSTIVMGGVSYPAAIPIDGFYDVVYRADMGEVDFTPSREDLHLTDQTKAVLSGLVKSVGDDAVGRGAIQKKINEETSSITEAMTMWHEFRNMLKRGNQEGFTYNGTELIDIFRFDNSVDVWDVRASKDKDKRRYIGNTNVKTASEGLWIDGRGNTKILFAKDKAKIEKHLGGRVDKVVYFSAPPNHPLFEDVESVKWSVIDAIEVPKQARMASVGVKVPEYKWRTAGEQVGFRDKRPLPTNKKLIYTGTVYDKLVDTQPDYAFVEVPNSRRKKFMKDNPKAISSMELSKKVTAKLILTKTEKAYLSLRYSKETIQRLNGKTNDKFIDELCKVDVTRIRQAVALGYRSDDPDYMSATYPLANRNHLEHTIKYINTIHKEKI